MELHPILNRLRHWWLPAVLALFLLALLSIRPHPQLVMLDVGQGLAVYFEDPTGWQMLYDGGPGQAVLPELNRVMPVWDKTLDLVVLSHPHSDHLEGLIEVLKRYQVSEIWLANLGESNDLTVALQKAIAEAQLQPQFASVGQRKILSSGYTLTVLHSSFAPLRGATEDKPPTHSLPHDDTLVLAITNPAKNFSALLTGDLDPKSEKELLDYCSRHDCPTPVDILQVSHHGSASSTGNAFLDFFQPRQALISVGANNSYHLPSPETIQRLQDRHIPIRRTDYTGKVVIPLDHTNF